MTEGRTKIPINGQMLACWEPGLGHISEKCVQAVELARLHGGRMWMIFNGTPVEVTPDSTPDDIFERWAEFRAAYQRGKGIK